MGTPNPSSERKPTVYDREFFCLDEAEEILVPQSSFIVGLDLGQSQDYTALTAVEKFYGDPIRFHVRHLERFALGTSYPAIVQRVSTLLSVTPLSGAALIIDATGVGRAVVDMLRAAGMGLIAVSITAGEALSHPAPDEWHVPKRDLVAVLQVLLQTDRLRIARLPEAPLLKREMGQFRIKVTASANDTYGAWREGEHDDLVLAVSLACWWGERGGEPRIRSL